MKNPSLNARIAALLYLVVVAASVFALITITGFTVSGDPVATAANIRAGEMMYRLAFASNLIAAVAYTAVVAMFYALFKPVNATLSLVAAFIGLAGCASSAAFMINQLSALNLLNAEGMPGDLAETLARQAMRLGGLGNAISLVFFGFYCLCLGSLVLGARFMPRLIGVLLLIAGAGWLSGNLLLFILPQAGGPLARMIVPASGAGELLFALWLLVFGVNAEKWRAQASAA